MLAFDGLMGQCFSRFPTVSQRSVCVWGGGGGWTGGTGTEVNGWGWGRKRRSITG